MQAVGECSLGDAVMAPAVFEVKIKKKRQRTCHGLCKSEQKTPKTEVMQSDKCEGYVQRFGFRGLSASVELNTHAVIFIYVC